MRIPHGLLTALVFMIGLWGRPQATAATLVGAEGEWRFFRGVSHPSPGVPAGWTRLDFDDSDWERGPATFVYGEPGYSGTDLTGMSGQYATLFLRRKFTVANPANLTEIELRAICDDGFVAYLNGVRVAATNAPAGNPGNTTLATVNAPEPIANATYPITDAAARLVAGENVLAVVVMNTSLGSSDLVFAAELVATEVSPLPPTIASVVPAPGVVGDLRQIGVTFDKPVTGVAAQDFLINDLPASQVTGSGARYTFTFPQPPYGTVSIGWGTLNEIQDLGNPPQRFSISAPGSSWSYELLDPDGPAITRRQPPAGISLRHLAEVEVSFNHAVTGVEAADLLLNGAPAVSLIGVGAGPYRFTFAAGAAPGTATLAWRNNHGIASEEAVPHAFSGGTWTYLVNPDLPHPDIVINEFVTENLSGGKDEDEDPEDWIELHNRGAAAVNLRGWGLGNSGDSTEAWVFPSLSIPAHGYLRVWASAKDRQQVIPGRDLHTDFKLNPTGDTLRLFGPELPREQVDHIEYGPQGSDYSFGRQVTGEEVVWRYFATPTPGAANGISTVTNTVGDVHFSVERGFYDTPFQLTLACPTPGAIIRYTTNGGVPLGTNGFVYTGPILINSSRVIRAAAALTNHLPSGVRTHTYLYGLQPRQRALPALSLVSATNNLYGRTGIMEYNPRNTDKHGAAWERPVSVEYIRPEDNAGFHVDAGLRLQGGGYIRSLYNYRTASAPQGKYSFRLYFRGEYGQGRLNYPLFPGTTVESFDTLVLRAGMNDHTNPFIKDEFARQLSSDLGMAASHGTFVHLFLNGVYKGYYNPTERIDDGFLQTYQGGGEDWDLIASFSELREGDATSWNQLTQLARKTPATNQANYLQYMARLDVTNFVDYLLMPIYIDADDWPHNNWRAARERQPTGLWRFYNWDVEWSFGDPDGHSVSFNTITGQLSSNDSEIMRLFNSLKRSPEFRLLFADRAHRAFFNGGALTDDNLRRRYEEIKARMKTSVTISGFRNTMIANWINGRRRHVLSHLERAGFYRSTNAPGFSPFGGLVPAGFALTLTNLSGQIHYTTDGTDPRIRFTEEVSPTAILYTAPIIVQKPFHLRARSLEGTNWSALTEATFQIAEAGIPLRITELMYNPPGGEAFEFIELMNTGEVPVDLSGFSFDGVNFRFATPFPSLAPGTRMVLANDTKPADFALRYPGVVVADVFSGSLSNGGERLTLLDRQGRVIDSVTYRDDGAWPGAPDGDGESLELSSLSGDPNAPGSWHASHRQGGTPGAENTPRQRPDVELNEVAAALPGGDWIELHNRGTSVINIAGWSLTDDTDQPRKFVFPAGTAIPADGYLRVDASAEASGQGMHATFALDDDGESLALFDASTHVVDSLAFGPQAAGFTAGRIGAEGVWTLCDPTPGSVNEPAPIAPPSVLAINEFLTNSDAGDDWIELHNTAALPAVVTGCFLTTSNALFQVRAPVFIAPGGFAVLKADEQPGPGHVDFKLPANGGLIALADSTGIPLTQVTYTNQMPQVTLGRLPDGTGEWMPLPFSATPGASNYLAAPGATVRFSEFMARNLLAVPTPGSGFADWVEIENGDTNAVDLGGYELRLNSLGGWTFPAGTRLDPGARTVVWATPNRLPSGTANLGLELPDDGGTVELLDVRGRMLDRLTFGFQLPDRSGGLTSAGWRLLQTSTPGFANAEPAALGDPTRVRFNEWLAISSKDAEWFELLNPDPLPVDLGGHFLTDDPSLSGITQFAIPPLSFVPGGGFVRFFADEATKPGLDHVNFRLDQLGETLRLSTPDRILIDAVHFAVQTVNRSEGRLPDGSSRIIALPALTPLAPNASPGFDSDRDGLPDIWEFMGGLNPDDPSDASLDIDGDGHSNAEEFAAGTDPRNPSSLLGLALDTTPAGAIHLRFTAVAGRGYHLLYRDAMASGDAWRALAEIPSGEANREITTPDPTPAAERPARFYRVATP